MKRRALKIYWIVLVMSELRKLARRGEKTDARLLAWARNGRKSSEE